MELEKLAQFLKENRVPITPETKAIVVTDMINRLEYRRHVNGNREYPAAIEIVGSPDGRQIWKRTQAIAMPGERADMMQILGESEVDPILPFFENLRRADGYTVSESICGDITRFSGVRTISREGKLLYFSQFYGGLL